MRFSEWMEAKLAHVNKIGGDIAQDASLAKGPKAWNQQEHNCYQVASRVAREFGYEPVPIDEIISIAEQYKVAKSKIPWMKGPEPSPPKQGVANFVVRTGEEFMMHVSFEYRGKEYNYGAASDTGFKVLFKIGLKPAGQNT